MAKKEKQDKDEDLTIEVFKGMQEMASKTGGIASLTMTRKDGWKWRLSVIPPGCKEDDSDEEEDDSDSGLPL